MAFYPDLSPFQYDSRPELQGALNVGWLSPLKYCPIGFTSAAFRRKLFQLCAKPELQYFGYHPCMLGLCKFAPRLFGVAARLRGHKVVLGSGIVIVRGTSETYAAPNLIYHYVARHWYRPPQPFIDAVLAAVVKERPPFSVSRLTSA